MIGPSLAAAPLQWVGVGDVLIFNLFFAAGLVLSGVAMFALVRRLTADWRAAMFAALAYAYLPYRFQHLCHVNYTSAGWIPLLFLGAENEMAPASVREMYDVRAVDGWDRPYRIRATVLPRDVPMAEQPSVAADFAADAINIIRM